MEERGSSIIDVPSKHKGINILAYGLVQRNRERGRECGRAGGRFSLACKDLGKMFSHSLPACAFFSFFFKLRL